MNFDPSKSAERCELVVPDVKLRGPRLTPRQSSIYQFIRDEITARGYGPTIREIGDKFRISSPNGVLCHLKALERRGLILRGRNKSRAIALVGETPRADDTHVEPPSVAISEVADRLRRVVADWRDESDAMRRCADDVEQFIESLEVPPRTQEAVTR